MESRIQKPNCLRGQGTGAVDAFISARGFLFTAKRRPILNRVRVQASFPDDLPTHSKTQIFYFDSNYLLRRLDYTAEVVGRWAHAAHLCGDHRDFRGIKIPTTRRVLPLFFGGRPLPAPTLVAIDIHDFRFVPGGASEIKGAKVSEF
jgi:hypothetical protein